MTSYTSQLGQDKWALEMHSYKRNGVFVEVGSGDGIELSNTYTLEKSFGWHGLCIEPSRQYSHLTQNRACKTSPDVISDQDGQEVLFVEDYKYGENNQKSGIKEHIDSRDIQGKEYEKVSKSLATVLKEYEMPKTIDYLSIDVEGSEWIILKDFPFHDWDIKLISVEHNFIEPKRTQLYQLLISQGYVRDEMARSDFDDWYYHHSMGASLHFRMKRQEVFYDFVEQQLNKKSFFMQMKRRLKKILGQPLDIKK